MSFNTIVLYCQWGFLPLNVTKGCDSSFQRSCICLESSLFVSAHENGRCALPCNVLMMMLGNEWVSADFRIKWSDGRERRRGGAWSL